MTITVILKLALGLILLLIGGNYLVEGGVAVAKRFRLSPLVIGMTIVAFGTSTPELLVSLEAAVKGNAGIAIGNVIGSNIINIGLILGITAMICPIAVTKKSVALDGAIMLLSVILLAIFSLFGDGLSRFEGIMLLTGIILFTTLSIILGRNHSEPLDTNAEENKLMSLWLAVLLILFSCVALSFGANFLVEGAVSVAQAFNMSEKVIGLTIVAFGTSLPELAASLVAAIKKQMDISIGNIIGSNLFNILCVLGLSATIRPITFNFEDYLDDYIVMFIISILLMLFIIPWKHNLKEFRKNGSVLIFSNYSNGVLGRVSGALLVLYYIVYTITLF